MDHRREKLRDQILFVLGTDLQRTRLGRMPDNMQYQAQKPLDKRLPSLRLAAQASLQQLSVYLKERHV